MTLATTRSTAFKFAAVLAVAASTSLFFADAAQAKGGAKFVYVPGQCNSGAATSTAVLIKSQNTWQMGVQMIGAGAADTWVINWFKNGELSYTTATAFPSTWLNIGMATAPSDQGTTVNFSAIATSASGVVCTVQGSVRP